MDLYKDAPEHVRNLRKSAMAKQRLKDRKTWKAKMDKLSGSEGGGSRSLFQANPPRQ